MEQKLATLCYDAGYTPLLQGTVTQQCFFTSYYIVQQVKRSVFQDDEMEMCYTSPKGSASSSAITTQSFVVVAFALKSPNRQSYSSLPPYRRWEEIVLAHLHPRTTGKWDSRTDRYNVSLQPLTRSELRDHRPGTDYRTSGTILALQSSGSRPLVRRICSLPLRTG